MKASESCYKCLQRLAYQATELATKDEQIKAGAIEKSLNVLKDSFSCDVVSIVIATRIHDAVKETTQNCDPYRKMKDAEIAVARGLFEDIRIECSSFKSCLKLAALGNAIDFFRPIEVAKRDLEGQVDFAIDDSEQFEAKLRVASKVLYLGDNAGEVFFDLPLIICLRRLVQVIYVVKAAPVQNDVTLEDVRRAGLEDEFRDMITTGTATPGIDFSLASEEFKHEFDNADLVFAKGMGYYESISELPAESKVFYCLKAKCQPVADSLGVTLNSYVALLR
jgi:uncharacterized protein with ATP-grasp and redox domains